VSDVSGLEADVGVTVGALDLRVRAIAASDWGLRRWLRERIDADLAAGRTRLANGWIVADTELAVAVLLRG